MAKYLVVFSHGFGVRCDDRGLFTDITDGLGTLIKPVMFDYNEIDETANTMTVRAFSDQVKLFKKNMTRQQRRPRISYQL